MLIEIDKYAGFCFGVTNAIKEAEKNSDKGIACLGEIVHNAKEEKRLNNMGMKTVSLDELEQLKGKKMMIRAHGEPPITYQIALKEGIEIVDATCPVVLKLQQKIKSKYQKSDNANIVIYGKKGHAEVNGLVGQTDGKAIVISSMEEAMQLDVSKPIFLFSQTTSDYQNYENIADFLKNKSEEINKTPLMFEAFQTICPSVKNRIPRLIEFCSQHEVIIFVSDNNSSNGKMLCGICLQHNPNTHFITGSEDLCAEWFAKKSTVGISGATSTPLWLMQQVSDDIKKLSTI